MRYIAVYEDKYLAVDSRHKYYLTTNPIIAAEWDSISTVKRVCKSLPKEFRYNWSTSTIAQEALKKQGIIIDNNYNIVKNASEDHVTSLDMKSDNTTESICLKSNENSVNTVFMESNETTNETHHNLPNMKKLRESLHTFSSYLCDLNDKKDFIAKELSETDKAIEDLVHYMELYNFNARDGYKLAKILKDYRLYRRELKDMLQLIGVFNYHTCNNIAKGHTENAFIGLENREYSPRKLNKLFENGIDELYKNSIVKVD